MTVIEPNPFAATAEVVEHGKVDTEINLASHEAAFRAFYEAHGENAGDYVREVWDEFIALLEAMSYRAHFFNFVDGKWMLENVCGTDSWIEADPRDYFNFTSGE